MTSSFSWAPGGSRKPKQDDKTPPSSLHDIVLDYVSTQAYTSTARALTAQSRRSQSHPSGSSTNGNGVDFGNVPMDKNGHDTPHTNGNGATDDLEGDVSMDVDSADPSGQNTPGDREVVAGALGTRAKKETLEDSATPKKEVENVKSRPKPMELSDADLESIDRRRAIINYILNGAIIRAIESLNVHFPLVLDENRPVSPVIPTFPSGSRSNGHAPTNPWTANMPRVPPSPWNTTTGEASSSMSRRESTSKPIPPPTTAGHSLPVFPQSTHPSHVKLNLQIQQFIESFRQLAPSSPSSSVSSVSSLTSSMHLPVPANGAGTSLGMTPATGTSGLGGSGMGSPVTLTHALTAAQGLHAEAKKLPPDVRAVYLQEIKDVGALFAYTDPETSILKGFLDQGRRIALADQVNRAILKSQGKPRTSFLETLVRRTTAMYAIMDERNIKPKPSSNESATTNKQKMQAYWEQRFGSGPFSLNTFIGRTW